MELPSSVRQGVEESAGAPGRPCRVLDARPVAGGSIHRAARVETSAGPLFVKWNLGAAARGFGAETRSLEALRKAADPAGLLAVPQVLGWRDADDASSEGWLLLSWLPAASPPPEYGVRLGRGLAALHRATAPGPGWPEDNLIGSLPQPNPPDIASWPAFWRDARLLPQLYAARRAGYLAGEAGRVLDRVVDGCEALLAPVAEEPASLLHGDLWSGNVHPGPDGRPVLVDPASYHGHREVDLAMSELFGGIPGTMLEAYREAWPLADGYGAVRRPLYQLYYLLVHVNLFGEAYVGQTLQAARQVVRAL